MKKILLSVMILLGLIIGVGPYFMGKYSEQLYRNMVVKMNDQYNNCGAFELEVVDYERGWFSSQVKVRYNFMFDTFLSFEFYSESTIAHGPITFVNDGPDFVIYTEKGKLEFSKYANTYIDSFLGDDWEITGSAKLAYDHTFSGTAEIPSADFNILGAKIESAALTIQADGPINLDQVNGLLTWPSFSVGYTDYFKGEIKDVVMSGTMRPISRCIVVGKNEGSIKEINLSSEFLIAHLTMKNIKLFGETLPDATNTMINDTATLNVSSINFSDGQYQTVNFNVSDLDIQIGTKNLLVKMLDVIVAHYNDYRTGKPSYERGYFPEIDGNIFKEFIDAKPEFELTNLSAKTSSGDISATGLISFDNSVPIAEFNNDDEFIQLLKDTLKIKFTGTVADALIDNTNFAVRYSELLDSEYVQRDGENYKIDIDSKLGQLQFNAESVLPE